MGKSVETSCQVCGTVYIADETRLKHGRQTTCSRACSYAMRAANLTNAQDVTCANCGEMVQRSASQLKGKHGSAFCSRACHYAGRSTGLTRRVVTQPYTYTPEGKAAMIESARRPKGKRVLHMLTCANCGVSFDDPTDGRKRTSGVTFCSLACCNAFRTGENNPAWRGGHPKYYGPDWRAARRAARDRDGNACRRCGKVPKRKPDVHHIIPVGSFPNRNDAHTLDNLVTLCHPCHMQVEWHGIDF